MVRVLRIAFGLILGSVAILFLFVGVVGLRRGRDGTVVTLGIAAIAGAITLFLLSPGQTKKSKKRKRRAAAVPSEEETEERPLRRQPTAEGFARYFDMRTWDFDLAKVTPAGWAFGLTSVVLSLVAVGVVASMFDDPANRPPAGKTSQTPRWVMKKVYGPVMIGAITIYFVFGSKLLRKAGYPVFRETKPPRRAEPRVTGKVSPPGGLPPRRRPGSG